MKRDMQQQLLDWKRSNRRKPLILRGARQVGKTWCLKSFGRQHYHQVAYLNFEEMPSVSQLFLADLTPRRILTQISLLLDISVTPGNTLIILDEAQACSAALNSLKYFYEKANEYHVAAAGSLLGVKMNRPGSFPVGNVNFLDLYPLSFSEFLEAMGKTRLRQYMDNMDCLEPLSAPLHEQLIGLLKHYTFTGGMPEVVRHYKETKDLRTVREIQKEVLDAYTQENIFKIYLLDVGLLGALADLPASVLVEDDRLFTEFKGAFIENLVATVLAPNNNKKLYYWSSQNRAEVDFIVPNRLDLYPLEVKVGISRKKKSLLVYGEKFKPPRLSRTTLMNLRQDDKIINIPLYLLHRFRALVARK